jgi:enterochelin esterase-like enzyme
VGLTSPGLIAVLAVTTVAALAGTLWFWRRLARPGLRHIALRVVALVVLQASMLSLTFVIVNQQAEFFSSWSDLLGTDTGGGSIVAVGLGASRAVPPVRVLSSTPVPVTGSRAGHQGRLQSVQFHGPLSGLTARGYVYLPGRRYYHPGTGPALPVVVAVSGQLTGQGASYSAAQLAATAASQIAAGRLAPLIMVMLPPGAGALSAADQGCLDVPGGLQLDTFFTQDLPPALRTAYRVTAPPARWGLLASPVGGYCALQLALSSSQLFAAAATPPGNYTTPPGTAEFGGSAQLRAQDSLLWQLQHRPMQPVSVLFTGTGAGRDFVSLVRAPMRITATDPATGRFPLAPVMDWLGRTLNPQK